METTDRTNDRVEVEGESRKIAYKAPTILEIGSVESLTHGSREQTADDPGSGYKGG